MNGKAIKALISLLDNIPPEHETGFNMDYYVACIAGWTGMFVNKNGTLRKTRRKVSLLDVCDLARDILGLKESQAAELFEPMNSFEHHPAIEWSTVTPQQAAKVLRHLVSTGEVDWNVAFNQTSNPSTPSRNPSSDMRQMRVNAT